MQKDFLHASADAQLLDDEVVEAGVGGVGACC